MQYCRDKVTVSGAISAVHQVISSCCS